MGDNIDSREFPASMKHRLIEPLTKREIEVLALICEGHSNQEISSRTKICAPPVNFPLLNFFGKLGVRRRTQAVAVGIHLKLVTPAWLGPQAAEPRFLRTTYNAR